MRLESQAMCTNYVLAGIEGGGGLGEEKVHPSSRLKIQQAVKNRNAPEDQFAKIPVEDLKKRLQ